MQRKRKTPSSDINNKRLKNSVNETETTLILKAYQNEENKKFNAPWVERSLATIHQALAHFNIHKSLINETNKKELADRCWNLLADYFENLSSKERQDKQNFPRLITLIEFCDETYVGKIALTSKDKNTLEEWRTLINQQLTSAPLDIKPQASVDVKPPATDFSIINLLVNQEAPKTSTILGSLGASEQPREKNVNHPVTPTSPLSTSLFFSNPLYPPVVDILSPPPASLPVNSTPATPDTTPRLQDTTKEVPTTTDPQNTVKPKKSGFNAKKQKDPMDKDKKQERSKEKDEKNTPTKKTRHNKKRVLRKKSAPFQGKGSDLSAKLRISANSLVKAKKLEDKELKNFLSLLAEISKKPALVNKPNIRDQVFRVYKCLLKLSYNTDDFSPTYKTPLIQLQNFLIGEIPEEKQLAEFKRLQDKLESGEKKETSQADVNITLPTEAMLLHPSHSSMRKETPHHVTGDASIRLLYGLKGMAKAIDKKALSYALIRVSDPNSASLLISKEDKEKQKFDSTKTLSFNFFHSMTQALGVPLIADVNGDILVNPYTMQAILDSLALSKGAVEESIKNKTSSIVLLRPPGHHAAEIDLQELKNMKKTEGFCFINNIFCAAKYAAEQLGRENILIIDFDTHDGHGTKKLLRQKWGSESNIYFINTYSQHIYPHSEDSKKETNVSFKIANQAGGKIQLFDYPFPKQKNKRSRAGDKEVCAVIEQSMLQLKDEGIDCILISFGLDAHEQDELGQQTTSGVALTTDFYTKIIALIQHTFPNVPLNIFLEGGYNAQVIEKVFENLLIHFGKHPKPHVQTSRGAHAFFPGKDDKSRLTPSVPVSVQEKDPAASKLT